ncbi:MAG TPA: ABC transporter ATP-binding protein [Acidobacteriaceae bacterium]|nr:ABC transporter ATP-binding protein [Acidobacteriaceae bacterium]
MSSATGRPGGAAGAESGGSSPWILEVRDVKKSYECGRIEALRGVSLVVARGDFLAITGASGSGKSTLLHLLGGLDTPSEGTVLFRGECVGPMRNGLACIDLDTYRARFAGFIFQSFHLLPALNAMENVQVPLLGNKGHHEHREEKARALLVELGLEHRLRQYPTQLSAGERQRVAIARALVNEPQVLLADEPTGNLDSVNSARILEILAAVQERHGTTLVMVTHDLSIAATAHRHIAMKDGRICD